MGAKSKIQWTDNTWNPAKGCSKCSPGCKYCYLMRNHSPDSFMSWKDSEGNKIDPNGTVLRTSDATFNKPLIWQKQGLRSYDGSPLKVFTSSLTDIFHPEIDSYRDEIWSIIKQCPDLIFQILTKRTQRIADHLPDDWGDGYPNVWLGASVENQSRASQRVFDLMSVKAKVRFLSVEPLIGAIDFNDLKWTDTEQQTYSIDPADGRIIGSEDFTEEWLNHDPTTEDFDSRKIHWMIVGGESGNETGKWNYRPMRRLWAGDVARYCLKNRVPLFIKQLGTSLAKSMRRDFPLIDRHGGNLQEIVGLPEWMTHRQFPEI